MSHKIYTLTRELVRELCPTCADKMQLARIKTLKLSADDLGNLLPDDEVTIKLFAGFSQGMCDKFGPDEGLFTRCAEAMNGKVDDEKAFCASLHKFCAGKWPAEKAKEHRTLADGIKVFMGTYPAEAQTLQKPLRKMFDEILLEKVAQDAVNRVVWSINDSISRIVDDKTLSSDKREAMLLQTVQQFLRTLRSVPELPVLAAYSEVERAVANYVVADLKNMSRTEVFKKCPECAGKMAASSQDMPVDSGGHMQHICGKGGRAIANLSEEDEANKFEVAEYVNAIKGVEIFKTGTHNGDVYTEKDLDDMVTAFGVLDYRPAIKIGHTKDSPGSPAYGWVQNVTRDGDKLRADFTDMHDSVVEAIRNKNYDRCSSEIYFNLKRGGKDYRRALKAVALLGAEVPAVAGLLPLHKMEFAAEGFERVGVMEQELNVSSQALVDTLAERVSGLVNLMKEYDMSKNTDKIAELKDRVDELNEQIVTLNAAAGYKVVPAGDKFNLMGPDGKMVSAHASMAEAKAAMKEAMAEEEDYADQAGQIKELSEQATALEQEIHALEVAEDPAAAIAALSQQLADSKAREEVATTQTKELSERVASIERERRSAAVGTKVAACKIPAFRNSLKAVYDYALEHTEATVKIYSADKDGKLTSADKTLVDVIDGVVTEINAQSEKLFKALVFSGQAVRADGVVDEDAGKEIQKRVAAYRIAHPEVKLYEQAMTAVLAADSDLAQRYSAQSGSEQ